MDFIKKFIKEIMLVSALILYYIYSKNCSHCNRLGAYNSTYPLTTPQLIKGSQTYRIAMVADLDTESKIKNKEEWRSYMKKGLLSYNPKTQSVSITWDEKDPIELKSSYSLKGRGMELSDLVVFNGKIYTFDDRTGIIYEIQNDRQMIPWIIVPDGDGNVMKGFKTEWATVKDDTLYIGSIGKEWTSVEGEFENENPMWVKTISPNGAVKHINWAKYYRMVREQLGISWPGYMIHESAMFSNINRKWYFLPRRCSNETYNEKADEQRACNVLISANEDFSEMETIKVNKINLIRGYSSFKFIPGTNDEVIVAVKTEELDGKTSTFISVFNTKGKVILDDEKVPTNLKYEGFEFI